MKIDYCYHTHTYRCGHACGTDREYVEAAIKAGIKELGFSDHAMIPGFSQPGIRGEYSCLEEYISSLKALREEYKDKITIYIGLECEYTEFYRPYYERLLKDGVLDYLICGQHFFFDEPHKPLYIGSFDTKTIVDRATDYLIQAIKSGLFSYIAHPDHFLGWATKYEPYFDEAIEKICRCAKEYDVPLEINLHGVYNRNTYGNSPYKYPCDFFFKKAAEIGCKIIIGIDAHNPKEIEHQYLDEVDYITKECKNNLISRIIFPK